MKSIPTNSVTKEQISFVICKSLEKKMVSKSCCRYFF